MGNREYLPSPIEIGHIELDAQLCELTEILARHAHDLWARQRLSEGWSWGEQRCDLDRTNPCLVPYEELPEAERQYDRQAAMGTLKAIVALGYAISRPDNAAHVDGQCSE